MLFFEPVGGGDLLHTSQEQLLSFCLAIGQKDGPVYTPLSLHRTPCPWCSLSSVILAILCLKPSHALGSSNEWREAVLWEEMRLDSSSFSSDFGRCSLIIRLVTSTRNLYIPIHYLVWRRKDLYRINFILSSQQPACCLFLNTTVVTKFHFYNGPNLLKTRKKVIRFHLCICTVVWRVGPTQLLSPTSWPSLVFHFLYLGQWRSQIPRCGAEV